MSCVLTRTCNCSNYLINKKPDCVSPLLYTNILKMVHTQAYRQVKKSLMPKRKKRKLKMSQIFEKVRRKPVKKKPKTRGKKVY